MTALSPDARRALAFALGHAGLDLDPSDPAWTELARLAGLEPPEQWYIVVVIGPADFGTVDGPQRVRCALSRRDGPHFDGQWRLLTKAEATEIADAWNGDPERPAFEWAEVVEVLRSASDPTWTEE